MIEAPGHLAAHLDVRELVLADGDERRTEREDVGALPDRVEGKPEAVLVAQPLHVELVLQRGVAHDPVEGQQHRQVPRELRDRRHLALHDDRGALGIDARGEPVLEDLERVARDLGGLIGARREGVQVGDEEVALVRVLQPHAVLERSDPVADVEPPRRGVAGEDARARRGGGLVDGMRVR